MEFDWESRTTGMVNRPRLGLTMILVVACARTASLEKQELRKFHWPRRASLWHVIEQKKSRHP
jgi:hypothetical protein